MFVETLRLGLEISHFAKVLDAVNQIEVRREIVVLEKLHQPDEREHPPIKDPLENLLGKPFRRDAVVSAKSLCKCKGSCRGTLAGRHGDNEEKYLVFGHPGMRIGSSFYHKH
ncbi:MAG TPA: hypothetical protein VL357_08195 [Rariglobus sp.]|jgi:hypothetical protein|nr:hypothetical protein [Rariglobus sp.]